VARHAPRAPTEATWSSAARNEQSPQARARSTRGQPGVGRTDVLQGVEVMGHRAYAAVPSLDSHGNLMSYPLVFVVLGLFYTLVFDGLGLVQSIWNV
jgi:hypothetical protein